MKDAPRGSARGHRCSVVPSRRFALLVTGALMLVLVGAAASPSSAAEGGDRAVMADRVLVLSLPTVTWSDLQRVHTPNLDRILRAGAVGNLVTNGVERPAPLADAYLSLGAGARATAGARGVSDGGLGFGVGEPFGRDRAGTVFRSRTGTAPGRGLVFMDVNDVTETNDAELYGAEVGLLGRELSRGGVGRAVIANGDGSDPSVPDTRVSPYRRAAVGALITRDGTVPAGRVDDSLLTRDRRAPFGVRLDAAAVEQAFTDVWRPQSVVLVEGSDLVRADFSSRFASDAAGQRLRDAALRRTDVLVGRLLDHVELERDLVVVVGAAPRLDDDSLTVAAVTGPGFAPGLLRSTTTQRDGFVNITDVAPTVLHAFGLERADAMEGRRMESATGDASLADRATTLADANTDGLFRDGLVGWIMGPVIGVAFGLGLLVVLVDRFARLAFLRGIIVFAALWQLGFLDAVYLVGPFHFARHGGAGGYWLFAIGVATILALGFLLLGRRKPIDAVLVGLGSVLVLHLADLVTGAHLEWITVFGYSPTIGVRFVGEGNMTFALLAASVTLFAGLFAWRFPTPVGRRVAIGLLVVTAVVIGAPFWGNDFGGAVSAAPGFALLAWLLLGHKLRWRTVGGLSVVLVAAGILVGLVDLLRPPESRTHVGKFFEQLATDFGAATLVLRRKLAENLAVLAHSLLAICLLVAAGLVLYLWFACPRTLRALVGRVGSARATGLALAVVAVLGFALNDSGIAIPGMMAAAFVSTLAFVVGRGLGAPLGDDSGPSDEPSAPPTTAEEPVPVEAGRS